MEEEFSRQEFWSGLSFPSPGDLPTQGTEPGSPALQADSLPTELQGKAYMGRPIYIYVYIHTYIYINSVQSLSRVRLFATP